MVLKFPKISSVIICLALFIFTVGLRIPVLRAVGETWDEFTVVNPGETYVSAWLNLDFSESSWIQNYEHPPLAKYFYGLSRFLPRHFESIQAWDSEFLVDKAYTVPRLLSAFFGGGTVVVVFLIGVLLFSAPVGIISALILAILPHFIAYTSIASLESVFIFFSTLFVYFLIRALKSGRTADHLWAVLALAATFATRYNGAFFVIFYATAVLVKYSKEFLSLKLKSVPWLVLLSPLIFLSAIYAIWPWLWLNPLHFFDSLLRSSGGHIGEFFLGSTRQPPWYYYFVYFLVTTPEVLVLLLAGFIVLLIKKLKDRQLLILAAWFLVPFLASFSAFKQDGIRYVIAGAPALTLISGFMIKWIFDLLRKPLIRIFFVFIVVVGFLYPIILYYPYYLDYYNLFSGGPKAAYENKSFEVGWWGEGGLLAIRYLNAFAPKNSVIRSDFAPEHTLIKLRPDLKLERSFILGNKDDFILVNTYNERYGSSRMLSDLDKYSLVYEVSTPRLPSFAAPLVRVYRRNTL